VVVTHVKFQINNNTMLPFSSQYLYDSIFRSVFRQLYNTVMLSLITIALCSRIAIADKWSSRVNARIIINEHVKYFRWIPSKRAFNYIYILMKLLAFHKLILGTRSIIIHRRKLIINDKLILTSGNFSFRKL